MATEPAGFVTRAVAVGEAGGRTHPGAGALGLY